MQHLYWPSMIYENEHSEDEECGCNTCDDLDGNVLYTICEVDVHDEPSDDDRAVCLHDLWDELRNAGAGKAMALDGPDEGTSNMTACLSEDERHGLQL